MGSKNYIEPSKPSISTFNATVTLNSIIKQATGIDAIGALSDAHFMSVANVSLGIETDALLNAISQVISRTIFSI